MVKLGSRVKDTVSGFTGIATGRAEYMYGCAAILIEPESLHDGKPIDGGWFDEQRVQVVEEKQPETSADNSASSGGPQNYPPSRRRA